MKNYFYYIVINKVRHVTFINQVNIRNGLTNIKLDVEVKKKKINEQEITKNRYRAYNRSKKNEFQLESSNRFETEKLDDTDKHNQTKCEYSVLPEESIIKQNHRDIVTNMSLNDEMMRNGGKQRPYK